MQREIVSHMKIEIRGLGHVRDILEAGNIAFKPEILDAVTQAWNTNISGMNPRRINWPWRQQPQLSNTDLNIRHGSVGDGNGYPFEGSGTGAMPTGNNDYARYKASMSSADSYLAAFAPPFVIGAMTANDEATKTGGNWRSNVLSFTDVPTTQLGNPYIHPIFTGTATITGSSSFLTSLSGFSTTLPYYHNGYSHNGSIVRIETGPDKGVYYIRNVDRSNSRVQLMTPDGALFNPITTQSGIAISISVRPSWFNETGIIPNGTGTVAFSGLFNPGVSNNSYIFKIRFEKSGSPSPSDSRQHGSYWFSIRPWTHGDGILATIPAFYADQSLIWDERILLSNNAAGGILGGGLGGWVYNHQNFVGGCGGVVFESTNQRMWFTTTDGTNGNVCFWRHKTPEQAIEVASTGGSPMDSVLLSSPISLTGTIPRFIHLGSDGTVYVAAVSQSVAGAEAAQAGLQMISTGLVTSQARTTTEWGFGSTSHFYGHAIDKTRFRTGTAADVTTTVSTNHINSTSGAFSTKDLGRLIKITGASNDNGTYLISAIGSSTQVSVTTTTGGGVSFIGGTGGTFNIGDRIYLFFNDTVTVVNKVYYVESLQPSAILSFAVTLTNGKKIEFGDRFGGGPVPAEVDPSTGVLYWATQDTQVQVNRFDPSTSTYSEFPLSTFNGTNGGTGSTTNPTIINALAINPNAAFRELWVGTDHGHMKINNIDSQTWTAPSFRKYYGTMENPVYSEPTNFFRTSGITVNNSGDTNGGNARQFHFGPDGRVWAVCHASNGSSSIPEIVSYNRDADNWTTSWNSGNTDISTASSSTVTSAIGFDQYGSALYVLPFNSAGSTVGLVLNGAEIHYQWTGSAWKPQEIIRGAAPDSTSSPGLIGKPLHTTSDTLLYGVSVSFTPQGGATPPNNEFLGRLGQVIGYGATDGATDAITGITHTFTGSGFTSSDVGRMLRVESGAAQGVFCITAFGSSTSISIRKYSNASYTGSNEASLTYTVWDQNGQSNGGPEMCSMYAANGFGKDNTQDMTNIFYDFYLMKTVLSEQVEAIKFCCQTIGAPGAIGTNVYYESLPTATVNYEPGVPGMRATPGTGVQAGDGTQTLDCMIDKLLDGTHGKANAYSNNASWSGAPFSDNSIQGAAWVFDIGASAEIGSIMLRGHGNSSIPLLLNTDTQNTNGLLALWLNELTAGTSPGNASTVRTTGTTNLSVVLRNRTITLASGDFTGSAVVGPNTTGSIITGQSTLVDAPSTFTPPTNGNPGHLGMILQITNTLDAGYYRIIGVSSNGSTLTIRNLNQTAYTWVSTESGTVAYQVKNGVQEGDMLAVTTGGHTQHRLCIEYLNSITSAQVRVTPNETANNLSWNCVEPTWTTVSRIEYSVQGIPPEVTNNGSWISEDGHELGSTVASVIAGFKIFASFSSLATWQRTGRYWKFAAMPRFATATGDGSFFIDSVEFFDPSGNRIGVCSYNMLDTVTSQPNFLASNTYRADFIQCSDTAAPQIANTNGLVNLGGSTGNTLTLATGGNAFLGFQVRAAGAGGSAAGSNNTFTGGGSDPAFNASDVTRFLNVASGPNAGYYRIATFVSGTSVTVTSPAGNPVTLSADAGPTAYTVHEGINVGTANPDFIAFTTGGNSPTIAEYSLATISDNLQTLTLNVPQFTSLSSQNFEIRRRANQDLTSNTTNAAISARALMGFVSYPLQSGDISQDSRGFFRFLASDIGAGNQKTNGQTSIGGSTFTGSGFTQDDAGRILVIQSGADVGAYKISAYLSPTTVTLHNIYTGTTTSFNANASGLSYKIYGERRFRMSRYTTVLRA